MSTYHKKICHLTSVHSKFDTRIFHKECKTLVNAGYAVTLVVQNEKDEVIDGVRIKAVKTPKNRRERILKTTKQVYERALECNADIYHFHDPELIPVGLKLKRKGKMVIYDVHEDVPQQILGKAWIPKPFRKIISYLVKSYTDVAVKQFDAIVGATPHITRQFLSLNDRAVNINNYPILKELFVEDLDWAEKERAVCYVGGITVERGIYNMVKAMEKVDGKLFLAGNFIDEKVKHNAQVLSGWGKIEELGFVDRNQVKEVFSKSIAGLLLVLPGPNVYGALPNKMFEYMSAGIAQITSNDPLWKELIEKDCKCGITVDPSNPTEIAEAINYLLANPKIAEQFGKNGRNAVEKKYNWEIESGKLINLYKELLS
jgi:glycosyltransferase involved in cell wall biosynthesis